MAKIVKNTTGSNVSVTDVGDVVPASGQYTLNPTEYNLWAQSDDAVTLIGAGAGRIETGYAVVADIIKIAKTITIKSGK